MLIYSNDYKILMIYMFIYIYIYVYALYIYIYVYTYSKDWTNRTKCVPCCSYNNMFKSYMYTNTQCMFKSYIIDSLCSSMYCTYI